MTNLVVGKTVEFTLDNVKDGVAATGNASLTIWTYAPTKVYLQSDDVTLNAAPFTRSVAYDGSGVATRLLAIPASLQGKVMFIEMKPSDEDFETLEEEHYVTMDDVDTSLAAVLAGEVVTQSKVDAIGAAAEAQLLAPATLAIPDSGSRTFVVELILKDLDATPVALVDPDGNVATLTAIDQTGGAVTGLTIPSAGAMTRDASGRYHASPTISSAGVDATQIRWTASYARGGVANIAKAMTMLGDFDQLDTIEAQVNAIRGTDLPAISSILTDPSFGLSALRALLVDIQGRLGTNADAAGTSTVFARLRQIVDSYLADATFGLSALNNDLDLLLARLGLTVDTGGTTTAGTAMAKLNAILAAGGGGGLDIQEKP